jgi:hypothetical protein
MTAAHSARSAASVPFRHDGVLQRESRVASLEMLRASLGWGHVALNRKQR